MDVYAQIATKIISSQEAIIGPVAVEQARQVSGLKVDWNAHQVLVSGDEAKVVDNLVEKYEYLFGPLSVEVCKEAAAPFLGQLPEGALPATLR